VYNDRIHFSELLSLQSHRTCALVLELHAGVSHLYLTVQLLYCQQLLIAPVAPLRRPNKKQMMKLAKERVAKEAAQRKRYDKHYYWQYPELCYTAGCCGCGRLCSS
jgi:hypothetical protein